MTYSQFAQLRDNLESDEFHVMSSYGNLWIIRNYHTFCISYFDAICSVGEIIDICALSKKSQSLILQ